MAILKTLIIHAIITLVLLIDLSYGKDTLHLGVLVSQDGETDLSGFLPALDLALKTIDNDTSLRYRFNVTVNDSMCEAASSLRSFIDQIFSQNLIMLIGSDCSVATEPVAEISSNWNLVQISQASSSPRLSNNETFPLFLRTVSSDAEIVAGIVAAMKEFGWSRVALITQSENIFTFLSTDLKSRLDAEGLQLIGEFPFNTDENVTTVMRQVRRSPARIIFVNMYEENAIIVMCEALRYGMIHPTYSWMFFNWYSDDWWKNASCTKNDTNIKNLLSTSLIFDHYPRIDEDDKNEVNVGGITWNEFESYHEPAFAELGRNASSQLEDSAYMFDAVWAAALALNNTNDSLVNFTYNDEASANISRYIYQETIKLKFFGLTGNVFFHENGDRPGRVRVLQYKQRDNDSMLVKVPIGRVENGSLKLYEGARPIFPGGVAEDEEYLHVFEALFAIYTVLSIFGIIFAVICLVFNLWFRKQKLVKLGSPYVNAMIVAGAVVFYITVILFGVDENVASSSTVDNLCQTRIWMVAIGFSLLYGTMFAKTWRIYFIFNHAKPNTKLEMKDIYLFAIVGALVLIDIVILIPPTAVSSAILRREQEEIEGEDADDLPGIIGVCRSDNSLPWIAVLFGYKGLVLLAGLFLAFETRKVKIRSLNESRFMAMSVYGAVIASITLTPIGFFLKDYPNAQYGIVGIMMFSITTLILGLVFVSKMYKVYRDPEGHRYLDKGGMTEPDNNASRQYSEEDYKRRIQNLNMEIKGLNEQLEMFKADQYTSTMQKRKDLEMTIVSKRDGSAGSVSPEDTHM
ncbi:gamma-aminobutyric acid type B receptor subunit 2-like [Dysidea avara]|uniref:gamma-aminobutyric acid type B receptor subunit 2-like n=1 Tax=Dysidea avara TaxID=196820 RepID=UPI0033227BB5